MVLTPGLMVHDPMSATVTADPTQLPELTSPGQTRHGSFTYGRSLSAGQTYVDPTSGVTVLKVTDSSTPISNSGINHGYATSGPRVSQPWIGGNGKTYYTLVYDFISYFVDLNYTDQTLENWRDAGDAAGPGDAGFAFSLNPATPRRCYYIDGGFIRAFDTDAMEIITPTGFPVNIGGSLIWLQTQLNDTWLACMSGSSYKGYKPSTSTTVTMSEARSGLAHDELHLDLLNPFVYMSVSNSGSDNAPWNLEADTFDTSPSNGTSMSDDHCAPGAGLVFGMADDAVGGGAYTYRGDADTFAQIITSSNNYHSANADFYHNANWCRDRIGPTIADLWFTTSREFQDNASAKVRRYAIACVKGDGSSIRLLCHHDSNGDSGDGNTNYNHWSKPQSSPDFKIVVFTSDMNNNTGRFDSFIAFMPVT